jgi:hypothetical protein
MGIGESKGAILAKSIDAQSDSLAITLGANAPHHHTYVRTGMHIHFIPAPAILELHTKVEPPQ